MKKVLSLLLIVTMILSFTSSIVFAEETESTIPDTQWYDEQLVELTISDKDDLFGFAKLVNEGNNFKGKTVKLGTDVDLDNEEWTPIGTSENKFAGTFDGCDNTVSNLSINGSGKSNIGFFGRTDDGEVKNLTIQNAIVTGRLNVGVVAGTPYTSKYTNITVTGHVEVNGMAYVGGVLGKNAYDDLSNITVDVDETSYVNANSVENGTAYRTYVGGVVGFMGEGNITVSNVTSNIDVIGSTTDVGGISGIAHYNNVFNNCHSSGDVTITSYTDDDGKREIGGIAGVWYNESGTTVTITNCTYTGKLTSNGEEGSNWTEFDNSGIVGKAYGSGTGVLIIDVAKIGENFYTSFADACADAAEGEIVLIQDVAMNGLNVATDKNVVINLNNKKLTLDGTQNTIAGSLTVKNGEIDITDSHCSANGIFYVTGALNLENVDFTGEEYSSAYGVIYANEGGVVTIADSSFALKNELYSAGGVLKGNAITTATFNITDTTFSLENPCSVIRNATVALDGVTIDAKITDLNLGVGDLRNHAFRNMVGSVENSTIAADGFETGIKNDTGALIVDNSTITLKNSYNGANLVISGEDRLSLKTGYYSFNPINYLADGYSVLESDKTGFFKVGETPAVPETVPETKVDVKDPTVIVPVDSGITEEALKTAVESVATQESLQSATAVAVQKDETLVGTVDNAKEELERENIAVDNETVTVIVKPYLEVEVLTVEAGSITLNIVPKCDVIATTAEENEAVNTEGTEKNAVVLEEGKTLEVVTPMTITIALPADFASVGDTIYINHVKDDGSTYIYDAVVGGTTGALTATFTNPNGFSTFTATTASEAVVKIGDIGYKTLEEAVGKVKADETIVLLVDNAEEVTVARDISFILDKDSNEFTGSISAGDNTTVTTSDDGEKTTYSFDYTAPSIPVGSGGTGAVSFIVDFRTNGGSIVSSVKVKKGEKVIRPEDPTKEGYTFGGWFTDEALKKEYDFDTKVQKKLVLYAKWIEEAAVEPEPELPVFTDVKETDWFYESVMTAFKKGLMNGVSETEFAPDTTLTRAMLVTILYRAEGEPATNRSIPFADIEMGSYYANAVIWAAQNGIVNGTTETTFAPDSNITREQVAAILYRYAIYKGMDAVDLSENLNFADSDDVSEYAISALNWATGCGLVTGYEDNTLRPLANTTRAEAATLLQRFIETDK